jgi:hypothetical protein
MKLELRTLPLMLLLTLNGAAWGLIAQTRDDATVYNEELKIVHFEDLDYPAEGRRTGVEGVVVIGATLNAQGQVIDARRRDRFRTASWCRSAKISRYREARDRPMDQSEWSNERTTDTTNRGYRRTRRTSIVTRRTAFLIATG